MFAYNKATLYGDSMVDYIWVHNKVDSQSEINQTLGYTYEPKWDANTFLLALFNNTLNGGNVTSVGDKILYWQVYKRKRGEATLRFLARVPASQYALYDFNAVNNAEYQYILFAETAEYISAPLQQDGYIATSWWNWSLTKLKKSEADDKIYYADSKNVWLFDTEVQSSALQQNLDKATIENFTQFPKISTGKKNYLTGSISAFLSNPHNARYEDTIEQYNTFIDFIADENPKLLKDRKGNGWIVDTTSNQMQYNDVTAEQITTVSFDFVQLDDLDDLNIIGG
nr:MAG TPA_asm: hypothetical protein [Caudoviricetes sp.]